MSIFDLRLQMNCPECEGYSCPVCGGRGKITPEDVIYLKERIRSQTTLVKIYEESLNDIKTKCFQVSQLIGWGMYDRAKLIAECAVIRSAGEVEMETADSDAEVEND